MNLDDVDPVALGVMLSLLPPGHVLLTAAALGIEIAHMRDLQLDTDNYVGGRWHRHHPMPSYTELERRRYPPTGDRELWIRYGPDGPPPALAEAA